MRRSTAPMAFACLCALATAFSAYAGEARLPVPGWGALVLSVPDGWKQSMKPGAVPVLELAPATGKGFAIHVSPLRAADGFMPDASPKSLRGIITVEAQTMQAQAVEKELPIRDLHAGAIYGSYFTATDRNAKPGEFKRMTQGAIGVQGLPVVFTILYNGDPKLSEAPALRMMGTARKQ